MQLSDWVTILQTEDKINWNIYFPQKTLQTNVSTKRHLQISVAYNQKQLSTKLFLDVLNHVYFGNFYKFLTNVYSVWSKLERKYHFPLIPLNDLLDIAFDFPESFNIKTSRGISPLKTPSKQNSKNYWIRLPGRLPFIQVLFTTVTKVMKQRQTIFSRIQSILTKHGTLSLF